MAVGFPVKDDYVTGDVLTAANMNDLSGTVNLLDSAQYAAGKNKIINGAFNVWQRGTSATVTSENYWTCDRWRSVYAAGGATVTWSQQTFSPGTAPVAGYEGTFFSRISATSGGAGTAIGIGQRIEDVRCLAGQTATFSFWAKAETARTITILILQQFGSGGSADVIPLNQTQAITTSWARYSFTFTMNSISGKTIGTNSFLNPFIYLNAGQASGSPQLDIWGVQLEAGSVATAFNTATGTLQGELAACQRYYYRIADSSQNYTAITVMHDTSASSATNLNTIVSHPVTMRVAATSTEFSNLALHRSDGTIFAITAVTVDSATDSVNGAMYGMTSSGLTAGNVGRVLTNNNSAGYFGISAEL